MNLRKEIPREKVITFLLYTLILIMPFLITSVNKFGGINDDKSIMLYIITFCIVILSFSNIEIKKISLISITLLIYGLLVIVATIFSKYRDSAIVGFLGRNEGMITILCYIVLFLASKKYFIIKKRGINIILFTVTIMSLLAIIQLYVYDPIYKQATLFGVNKDIAIASQLERLMGTIGHRNFMSTYLIIFLPISVSFYVVFKEKKYFIFSTIIFIALLCTTTRSGWISVASFAFLGGVFIRKNKEYLKRSFKLVVVAIIAVFIVNLTMQGTLLNRANTMKNDVVNFSDKSGSNRVKIWKNVFECIKSHPLLGTGPDTVYQALAEEREKDPSVMSSGVDKAHNEFLHIAINSGIPSLVIYIVFLVLLVTNLFKHRDNRIYRILSLVFISFITQSFFNISVISVAPIVWILFGIMSKNEIIIYNR